VSAEGFDVGTVREFSERQRADAERIIALCDALANQVEENKALRARLASLEAPGLPLEDKTGK
jgi:hypothetical protein